MFHLIERRFIGDSIEGWSATYVNYDEVVITTSPVSYLARSHGLVRGYRQFDDSRHISVVHHGIFTSLAQAKEVAQSLGLVLRKGDTNGDKRICAHWYVGKYAMRIKDDSLTWINKEMKTDVSEDTSDEGIDSLFALYEQAANEAGLSLSPEIVPVIKKYRDVLRVDPTVKERIVWFLYWQ